MPRRLLWLAAPLLVMVGVAPLALTIAQGPAVAPPAQPIAGLRPSLDPAKLAKPDRDLFYAALRGAEWLQRANRRDGGFGYITSPALGTRQENESFPGQAGAAAALARSARFFGDEASAVKATHAVLTLLIETTLDTNKQVRTPTIRGLTADPLAAAGALLQAIHELPNLKADLLEQSEQLCQFIRLQQRADGGLGTAEDDGSVAAEALHGLMCSQQQRPAAWKVEVVRKAHAYYHLRWMANKQLPPTARFCAVWAEMYRQTRDGTFANSAFATADWLCSLQYQKYEPARALWFGGFQGWREGKAIIGVPDVSAALSLQAITDARRIARQVPDAARHQRYHESLVRGLQFLLALQYTDANTQHFVPTYRSYLVGAFHASHQDGDIRLDYTHHAVAAFVMYLMQGT